MTKWRSGHARRRYDGFRTLPVFYDSRNCELGSYRLLIKHLATLLNGVVGIQCIKEARKRLEVLPVLTETERPMTSQFLSIEKFDTELAPCLSEPKRALSYQTGWWYMYTLSGQIIP